MKKTMWQGLPLLLVVAAAVLIWHDRKSPSPPVAQALCTSLEHDCALTLNGRPLRIGVYGPIKAMQPFELWVSSPGVHKVEARFTMKSMDMGVSAYPLTADAQGVFRTHVTLAMCMSGDRDWIMTLEVDGATIALPVVMTP